MKLQKIEHFNDVKIGDLILLHDNDGRIKGIDKVKTINYSTGHYSYININNEHFEGNLKSYLKDFQGFYTDPSISRYNDKNFNSSILDLEWVFENLYGDNVGSFIRMSIIEKAVKSFEKRIELMDFIKRHKKYLHIVRWGVDEELGYIEKDVIIATSHIKNAIEFELSFLHKKYHD